MNLLQETKDALTRKGYKSSDIKYIGDSAASATWSEFEKIADFDYDSGYGWSEIYRGLIIILNDNSRFIRGEYDGAEWWEHISSNMSKTQTKLTREGLLESH